MLQLENLGEFTEGIDRWIESCEDLANGAFRGIVFEAFSYVIRGTPEWSGNLAASWRLTVGAPHVGYEETPFKLSGPTGVAGDEPYSRVSPNYAAIEYALASARGDHAALVRINADAYITNNAPYAEEVQADRNGKGQPLVRAVNLPIEMTLAAAEKFGRLGEISEAKALELSRVTL